MYRYIYIYENNIESATNELQFIEYTIQTHKDKRTHCKTGIARRIV